MMKYFCLVIIWCFSIVCFGNELMVPSYFFVNEVKTDLNTIYGKNEGIEGKVHLLFDEDKLDHPLSKAFDNEATFDSYWKQNKAKWHSVNLNNDEVDELIYSVNPSGKPDESSLLEIYSKQKGEWQPIYRELGSLFGYKIHPKTKEIVLYQHTFPCCSSASNTIQTIRFLSNKMKVHKKYFLANGKNMKGHFFPPKVSYLPCYFYLKKETVLKWSSENIVKNAWLSFSENNVGVYAINTPYRILFSRNKWKYVIMYGLPVKSNKQKSVLQPQNFRTTTVFGWIRI